jgi:hypothetical protein
LRFLFSFWLIPSLCLFFIACGNPKQTETTGDSKVVYSSRISLPDSVIPIGKIVYFLSPDCPVCLHYSSKINQIFDSTQYLGILTEAIYPGKFDSAEKLNEIIDSLKLKFNGFFTDPDNELVEKYTAVVTPQVFLLDSNDKVIYSGRIDNRVIKTGVSSLSADSLDLENAIKSYLSGRPVSPKTTQPFGCFIE